MADSIRAYLDARKALAGAVNQVESIVRPIHEASQALQKWQNVIISNVEVSFPGGERLTASLNANHWPTMQQLAQALAAYHAAYHVVRQAWSAIPESDRSGLQPPPSDR